MFNLALAIDATVAGASANSYCTVVETDAFFEGHLDGSNWSNLETAEKTLYLVHACRDIDSLSFQGFKTTTTQKLQFPRDFQTETDSYTAITAIPAKIKQAQMEHALHLIKYGVSRRDDIRAAGVKVAGGGRFVAETLKQHPFSDVEIAPAAIRALNPYLRRSGTVC